MLALLKSVAQYLKDTASVDLSTIGAIENPNESTAPGAAIVSSGHTEPSAPRDLSTDIYSVVTIETGSPWIGVTWTAARRIDGIRFHWPTGPTVCSVKLQTYNGTSWADETGAPVTALAAGWNTLRLVSSARTLGVRVVYVSGGSSAQLCCSEFEAYREMRTIVKPGDWALGGCFVEHAELDLSAEAIPMVTVGLLDVPVETGQMGGLADLEHASVYVGIHCTSEDMASAHVAWARLALQAATGVDIEGSTVPGIQLRGIRHRLAFEATTWWQSGQPGWYASPAPVVYLGGAVVTPADTDYQRGRVKVTGSVAASDVRADFRFGVWPCLIRDITRGPAPSIRGVESIHHTHNTYFLLEAESYFRSIADAIA